MEYTILDYIPQRPPFVMVDNIVTCNEDYCKTTFEVRRDNLLLEGDTLLEGGVIENIAQSCAARIGYLAIHRKMQSVRIGVIGGIKDLEIQGRPKIGDTVTTEISTVLSDFGDMSILNAKSTCNGQVIATGEIKVALI